MPQQNSSAAKIAGLGLAATGLSHFVAPQIYEGMTKAAFPDNTRTHVYVDGGIETALGLGLAAAKTRKLALLGLLAYGAYLGGNVIRQK
ncbi:hypothetical protein FK535_12335 [Mycolicibacterium sp. 018/SC-01/001]|uniref:hypothetical protein n=1 Tax=Mycolicibacterium sp. 018/SC-01/001 TaxID=2592069 RepID=UPI00117C12E0|nr:hypothetical protein [Mycolicibacterium sp. 018/SC-01/001]TRW82746.1 hypothetical protein FK535_12335 [Mycolicibacterium sp. 018/SC-01/001]